MSITYYILVVLLLCVPLSSCNARRLGAPEKQLEERYSQLNMKNDDTKGSKETLVPAASTDKTNLNGKIYPQEKPKDAKNANDSRGISIASGEVETSSLKGVSKSWKVPQRKGPREEHPGFNLDYMQPGTHPPHHN